MENIGKKLDGINETLREHNEIARKMLDVIPKPENNIIRALLLGGIAASALGIVHVVDTILSWLTGG